VLGHKLQLNRAIAQHAVLQAEHRLAAQEIRVRTDARIAFYQALTARRQTELTAELVRIAQLGVDNARRQNKGTDIGENDVLEARIELHRAEIEVRNAANRHAAAWRSLAAVVGLRDLPQQELDGRLEDVPQERTWEGALQTTLQTSPEMAAAVASRDRALATLRRAGVEMIPNVTVDGLVNWRDNGIDGKTDGGFLVSLPLPVWNRNQGGVGRSRGEVLAAEQVIQQLELSLQNRLAPVFERYANAHFQVGQFRELILPEAAGALALTRKNYEVGLVEYVDLLTSQRTNAQVNIDYLKALGELWIAESELAGMTLTGSLGGQ